MDEINCICLFCHNAFKPVKNQLNRYCSAKCRDRAPKKPPAEIRFRQQIQPASEGDCILWTGRKTALGYGRIYVRGGIVFAHRFSYTINIGPIPVGQCVCHRCDNPACVNPNHLFLGSKSDNSKDMTAKKRQAYGTRHGMHKLGIDQLASIRAMISSGVGQYEIAAMFGVNQSVISRIKTGESWWLVK